MFKRWTQVAGIVTALMLPVTALAAQPVIAIIIDDIGYRADQDRQALSLPGPVAYAILPHTPGVKQAVQSARKLNKEILLHMPMENFHGHSKSAPGTLTQDMEWVRFVRTVQKNLASVPNIVAVNNHEGSALTSDKQRMQWLMEELKRHGDLPFIDSRTTHHTVALDMAKQYDLTSTRRDVFLDYAPGKIEEQFGELIALAKKQGSALAIAHPHPETVRYLKQRLPRLAIDGVQLVPVSRLLQRRNPTKTSLTTGGTHAERASTTR